MRVLLATFGSYGDLNPYLGLGLALKARGHRPVLAVMPSFRGHVESAGLEFRPMRPDGNPSDQALVARIMDPMRGAQFLVRDVLMPRVREMYDDLAEAARDADLVVSHPLTIAAPVLCEKRGLPWASSVLAPLNFFSALDSATRRAAAGHRGAPSALAVGVEAAECDRPVHDAPLGQAGPRAARVPGPAARGQPRDPRAVLAAPDARLVFTCAGRAAGRLASAHGRDRRRELRRRPRSHARRPCALPRRRPAADRLHAGQCGGERESRPAVLRGQRRGRDRAADDGRSCWWDGRRRIDPSSVGREVFVTDWAPHSELFHRAAAVVHQGGAGTLHTALAAGRPMLVVPFAHDQPDNAARVERLGVARVLYPQHYSPARVRRALDRLLSDPVVTGTADTLGALVRAEDGGAAATRALTQLHNTSI